MLQPLGLFSLQLFPDQSHILLFLFSALPVSTYNIQFLLTQHQTTFFFSRILYHLHSETPPFLITAAFLSISDCLQHVKIGVPVASIYPISSKSGCHATPGHHFHAPWVAASGHNPTIPHRSQGKKEQEKRGVGEESCMWWEVKGHRLLL